MTPWIEIEGRARDKLGTSEALEAVLPAVLSPNELADKPDAWFLSTMSRRIFQAGMQHRVINQRWPRFEQYFWGFDPEKLILLSEEQLEQAMQDPGLIRHWGKLRTIPFNASVMVEISRRHGSFGHWLNEWRDPDLVVLWRTLAKRFQRLGGMSGARFLRLAGRDTFLLTDDVVQALQLYGVVDGPPSRQADLARVNHQFVIWSAESRRPMAHVSRILSHAIGNRATSETENPAAPADPTV